MDGNARLGRGARGAVLLLALVALLSLIAIAAGGDVASGTADARRPGDQLLDTLLSLFMVLMAVGSVFVVAFVLLTRRDQMMLETLAGERRHGAVRAVASLAIGLGLVFLVLKGVRSDSVRLPLGGLQPSDGARGGVVEQPGGYDPEFAVWPVVITCVLVLLATVAIVLNRRAQRTSAAEPAYVTQLALADTLDETLDDLRRERDPRRAVIAAYARLERVLGAAGFPRLETEAPEEYLDRILAAAVVSPHATRRLTDLFTWARFSGHDVRPGMKDEAIDTLEQVRDELRAAAASREAAGAPAVTPA